MMEVMSILVTGGAGYIGAHVVRLLQERGEEVVVVDDLSYGDASRIGDAKLIQVDIASDAARRVLTDAMIDNDVTAVIHFAARKQVGESVERPAWYYQQNVGGMATLLRAMYDAGVDKMIFSSSAAVYGMPPVDVVNEDTTKEPINPYGETKLICERLLADCERAWNLQWVALRYFNVAGAGSNDLMDPAVLNLVPMVLDRLAAGKSPAIFGEDYETSDGTCIRDYVHVVDLADAHLHAMDKLNEGSLVHREFNVGTGTGTSVRQIVEGMQRVSGWEFPIEVKDRRAGDPPLLIGDASRIEEEMGWVAKHDVDDILTSSWDAWQATPRRISVPEA